MFKLTDLSELSTPTNGVLKLRGCHSVLSCGDTCGDTCTGPF